MESTDFGELDDIDLLREADLFSSMPESVIRTITLQAHTVVMPAGSWVIRRGEPGNSVFVVKSGVVEVLGQPEDGEQRALAYLGRGECLGELAILTDSPRHADVRVPEQAELMVIEKDLFQDLLANHPGFGSQLCVVLARRLAKLLQDLPAGTTKKELQGSLRYFDLATVIQTLIGSGQSGLMSLMKEGKNTGSLYFQGGNIARAQFGHRTGDEAVHQLFQVPLDADFLFTSSDEPPQKDGADPSITMPSMALMLDSVRLQDELDVLKQKLPDSGVLLERTDSVLNWSSQEGRPVAEEVWARLTNPATLSELLDGASCCHYHAVAALLHMLETEQLMPVLE